MMHSLGGTKLRRYIDLRHNSIQDAIFKRVVDLQHIPTTKQLADGMTKLLKRQMFQSMLQNLNVIPGP